MTLAGITYGQTLKKDAVMMFCPPSEVVLKPGVTMDEYIDFLLTIVKPEVEKTFPGTNCFYLKGDRGEEVDQITRIWYFESTELRDKYITPEGIYADNKKGGIMLKLDEMENEYIEERKWTMYTQWLVL